MKVPGWRIKVPGLRGGIETVCSYNVHNVLILTGNINMDR